MDIVEIDGHFYPLTECTIENSPKEVGLTNGSTIRKSSISGTIIIPRVFEELRKEQQFSRVVISVIDSRITLNNVAIKTMKTQIGEKMELQLTATEANYVTV
jgi:hypothetical protein